MTAHFADRLIEAIERRNAPVCVGLDLQMERLPESILEEAGVSDPGEAAPGRQPADSSAAAKALKAFGEEIIQITAPIVPAVKINIAFFEMHGVEGIRAYLDLVRAAHRAGLLVIGDVKRADIGNTSQRYARAHLTDDARVGSDAVADAITVNPYFGFDSIEPFVAVAVRERRGVFVLVQTSNPSAAEIQGLALSEGGTVAERIGTLVHEWSRSDGLVGDRGYSCVGAVVSPRDVETTIRLRRNMPRCLFLVPGFGTQGRSAEEVAHCFDGAGRGAVVNASRSVVYAFDEPRYRERYGVDWRRAIQDACEEFVLAVCNAASRKQ